MSEEIKTEEKLRLSNQFYFGYHGVSWLNQQYYGSEAKAKAVLEKHIRLSFIAFTAIGLALFLLGQSIAPIAHVLNLYIFTQWAWQGQYLLDGATKRSRFNWVAGVAAIAGLILCVVYILWVIISALHYLSQFPPVAS